MEILTALPLMFLAEYIKTVEVFHAVYFVGLLKCDLLESLEKFQKKYQISFWNFLNYWQKNFKVKSQEESQKYEIWREILGGISESIASETSCGISTVTTEEFFSGNEI